jgi:poly-beta-1,6-N-acetyl-D-glucosamine synthase
MAVTLSPVSRSLRHRVHDATTAHVDISRLADDLTVLVPAYNEADSVADTVRSLLNQTCPPKTIVVIDDFSSDDTGNIARAAGATVLRPPHNTGTKAGAQNFALGHVTTSLTMAIDADTVLAPDAIEKLLPAMMDEGTAAACGFILPRHVRTVWERGRYMEYMFAFTFYKPTQDYFGKVLISSGCFSVYRTRELKRQGGWSTRTMAEDMDLTWSYHSQGYGVRFIPEAVCYPIEPHNFHFMSKQLRRWSHGFVQNVQLHWRSVLKVPYLRTLVAVALWDSFFGAFAYLLLIPLAAILLKNPLVLLTYFIDLPAILIPTLVTAVKRREVALTLTSVPSLFVLRYANCLFFLEAVWSNFVLRRPLRVYEKGH